MVKKNKSGMRKRSYWDHQFEEYVDLREAAGKGATTGVSELAEALSDKNFKVRWDAASALGIDAQNGEDIWVAVPALAKALSDYTEGVRFQAANALEKAAEKGGDISAAVPALVDALSDERSEVRRAAVLALENAAGNGTDISVAMPALAKLLSDGSSLIRQGVTRVLVKAAEKTEVNLEEVQKALGRFVETEKAGTPKRKILEREATGYYLRIAKAESKRRKAIGMGGVLLRDKPKPPKGPKMFRERVAV